MRFGGQRDRLVAYLCVSQRLKSCCFKGLKHHRRVSAVLDSSENRGAMEGQIDGFWAMPRKAKELGALAVSNLRDPGLHFVGGVSGLALQVLPTGARSWILRIRIADRRRDMGLGGYPDVTLAQAREAARSARFEVKSGSDPIDRRREARSALNASKGKAVTFEECGKWYVAAHENSWKSAKHRQQWGNTLAEYVYPEIGRLIVADVGLSHIMRILEPIWSTKTRTAKRVQGRIERIIDWATTRGYRDAPNPARWRGHLDKLLAAPNKLSKPKHYPAMPFNEMHQFVKKLRATDTIASRALEFLILTAARSGEVRGACWREFNLASATWIIPAERMKAGKEHRVYLSASALQILSKLKKRDDTEFVFASKHGNSLSDMALTAVLRRMGLKWVPHGFRSTFRDWVSECTEFSGEVAEMALAHTIGNKVEAAYRRGDLFEKRAKVMEAWDRFLNGENAVLRLPINRAVNGV